MIDKLTLVFCCLLLSACAEKDSTIKITGHTMGTTYHISAIPLNKNRSITQAILKQQVDDLLEKINQKMSTYQIDSEISRFNRYQKTNWFNVSKEFAFVVAYAQKISRLTDGAFDITVLPLVNLWGFGAKKQDSFPPDEKISAILADIGYSHLDVRQQPAALKKNHLSLTVDLSAIAKGYAVDAISRYLDQQGFNSHLIEIGGEIKAQGKNANNKNWKIAIEEPSGNTSLNRKKANRIVALTNMAIATSGDYRNYFVKDGIRYSHTIDPKTGRPITHQLASVTILNKSCMIADAYATAVMVMGGELGKKFIIRNKISANLIIRSGNHFITWSNLLDDKNVKKGGDG